MDIINAVSAGYDDGDVDTNRSQNLDLNSLIEQRYSRRQALRGGIGAIGAAAMSATLVGCGDDDGDSPTASTPPTVVAFGSSGQTSGGKVVTLGGTVTNGTITNPRVTQVSGPPVNLSGANTANATFIAPSVATSTPVVFRFTGTDSTGRDIFSETTVTVDPAKLDFAAVAKNRNDIVTVPPGYTTTVLFRLGDPLNAATSAYANNGTDASLAARAGDHHDALYYYGLAASGNGRDDNSSRRGVLVMNHENITQIYLHPNGPTTGGPGGTRPEAEALKEMEAHGLSVVEVTRAGDMGAWSYVQAGALNRRITPLTPMAINGPVRGSSLVRTVFSPEGTGGRGTINNCANGYTPWGTNLTCEENWAGYFRRVPATDNPRRSAKEIVGFNRYGLNGNGGYGWASVVTADTNNTIFRRWNASVSDPAVAATADFRNEANQFGWVVEIDPYDAAAAPRKRTALGRFNHEGAWPGDFIAGRRPAFYMGDDARGEYVYKFVSATPWVDADAQSANRLAIGDKYLDAGTLYVARFLSDGRGSWVPLVFGQGPLTAVSTPYAFADQANVLVHTRLAADAVGATRMDRPEWTAVNPATGEMYLTLTNNSQRTAAGTGIYPSTDTANPRAYVDPRPKEVRRAATPTATSCACARTATRPKRHHSAGTSIFSARDRTSTPPTSIFRA